MAWFLTKPLLLKLISKPLTMKTPLLPQNRLKYCSFLLLTVLSLGVLSCKKDDIVSDEKVKGEAKIKVINASPAVSTLDFYLDSSKVNSNVLLYGVDHDYIKIHSGEVSALFSKNGTVGATSTINFVPSMSYTSFYVEDRTGTGSMVTLEDNFGATNAGMARIRIVNLSPNFSNTVNVSTTNDLIISTLAFKEVSTNISFNPDVDLRFSIIGSSIARTISAKEFEAGKTYTVWIGGTSNSTISLNKITY